MYFYCIAYLLYLFLLLLSLKGELIHHSVEEGINQTDWLVHKTRKIKVHDFKFQFTNRLIQETAIFFSLEVFKSTLDPFLEMDFNQKVKYQRKMDVKLPPL